jgi:exopolyphosphatase/guanosine-5'-triphosphate,3'-diphosphate pyrophosphatase
MEALKGFCSRCQAEGVEEIAAVGTNALRLARDADQFIHQVSKECGISPRIISEKEEALLSFVSVQKDPCMPQAAVVIDVGGGSTECVFSHRQDQALSLQAISLPLGAVNLTEEFLLHDPPSRHELLKLQAEIEKALYRMPPAIGGELVGIGGTSATLGSIQLGLDRFDREKIHGLQLTIDELKARVKELQGRDLVARRQIRGLPPERADIILAGTMIILSTMEKLAINGIHISCHGIRYGLFYQRFMGAE